MRRHVFLPPIGGAELPTVLTFLNIGLVLSFSPFENPEQERPALWNALFEKDVAQARSLITAGKSLDDIIEPDGDTFLHRAAQDGDAEMVKFYLENDCDKTLATFDYIAQTPLIRACASGNTDIVVRLLSAPSDPNAQDEERIGTTALIEAVHGGHVEIVSLLLKAGGDPTIPGWMAISAVDMAYHSVKGGRRSGAATAIQRLLSSFPSTLRDKSLKGSA